MKTKKPVSPAVMAEREKEKQRRHLQQRMKKIASVWTGWLAFETPLLDKEPHYLDKIKLISKWISQEIVLAETRDKQKIRWDEARNRILTLDLLNKTEASFAKTHRQIHSDVAKIASHGAWMSVITRNGEYWILNDIINGMRGDKADNGPVFAKIPEPIIMNAAQINEHVRRENVRLKAVTAEFIGDEAPKPKTAEFGFLGDVHRQTHQKAEMGQKFKKPRKNWRREQ